MSDPDSPLSDLAARRISYDRGALDEGSLAPTPLAQFIGWFEDARAAGIEEPNAMVLATSEPFDGDGVGGDAGAMAGLPSARTVLLRGVDGRGFSFFTNLESRKGRALHANPRAALVFPWLALHRQVVVVGEVALLPRDEVAAYFHSRPIDSRLGAWASRQSEVITSRAQLEQAHDDAARRFQDEVPVPPHWGGYVVMPRSVEFWQGRPSRLHDRLVYRRLDHATPDATTGARLDVPDAWEVVRLSP